MIETAHLELNYIVDAAVVGLWIYNLLLVGPLTVSKDFISICREEIESRRRRVADRE